MYPIAYAVVEHENFNSWNWFLAKLKEDIREGSEEHPWSFMADRQKVYANCMKVYFLKYKHMCYYSARTDVVYFFEKLLYF